MAKKNKKVTLIEKATKKAKVNATAKKATSAVKGSSASTKKKAAEEAKKKAEELKKKREAAKRSQESAMKNTKATQKKRGAVLSDKSTAKKQASKRANNLLADIKKTTNVGEAKKAVEKGQQKSALGTKVEKKTGTVEVQKYSHPRTREKVEYEYTPLTMQEYGKQTTAAMTGQYRNLMKSDKELNKKVSDLNVKDYANSPGVMGALDQMTQGLSVSEDPIYNYSESQKKIMDSQKQTGRYNVGRMVGAVAEFGLGGTGTIGSSIAKTAGKTALKEAAEQGGRQLAKTTAKNIAKETAADTLVSAPLNILDAIKFSYEDGKINKKKLAEEVVFNVAGDILIGGALSGLTHGLSAKQVSRFNTINNKIKRGDNVSEAELKFHQKHLNDFTEKVEAKAKQEAEQPKAETSNQISEAVRESARRVGRDADNDNVVKLAEKISKDTNTRIEFATNDELVKMYGKTNIGGVVTEDGRMLINSDSDKALQTIIGHETSHILESTTQYNELKQLVKEYAESLGEYGSLVDEFTDLYKGTNANIEDEVTAELIGKYLFTDDNFIRNLSATQPNAFQKIYQRIKDLLASVTKGSAEEKQLLAVQRKFEDAYREAQGVSKTSDRSRNLFVGEGKDLDDDFDRFVDSLTSEEFDEVFGELSIVDIARGERPVPKEVRDIMAELEESIKEEPAKPRYREKSSEKGKVAKLADERIERLFRQYGAKSNPEYAQAYITSIHPRDFLSLTISDEYLKKWDEAAMEGSNGELFALDLKKLREEEQTPYLHIDETGRVVGHEGRHRMRALLDAGVTDVPVAVIDYKTKYTKQPKKYQELRAEEWSDGPVNNDAIAVVTDLIPIGGKYRDDVMMMYGGKGDVRFSLSKETATPTEQQEKIRLQAIIENSRNNEEITEANRRLKEINDAEAQRVADSDKLKVLAEEKKRAELVIDNSHDASEIEAALKRVEEIDLETATLNARASDVKKPVGDAEPQTATLTPEEELAQLRAEYKPLRYKIENTKNPENYSAYVKRQVEIADRMEELNEQIAVKNPETDADWDLLEKHVENATYKDNSTSKVAKVTGKQPKNAKANSPIGKIKRLFVDDFSDFERFAKTLKGDEKNEFLALINNLRLSENRARAWISAARTNLDRQVIGKSLKEILGDYTSKDNADKYAAFNDYLYHKHNISRAERGKPVFGEDITAADSARIAKEIVEQYPEFVAKQQEIVEYFRDLQQVRVDGGLISEDLAKTFDDMYQDYVPTYRVQDGESFNSMHVKYSVKNGVNTATGSNKDLLFIHEQAAMVTEQTFKSVEANQMLQAYAKYGGFDVEAINKKSSPEDVIQAGTYLNDDKTVTFWENGEAKKVSITDEMYDGLKSWSGLDKSEIMNWKLTGVTGQLNRNFKRLITDWNPLFAVTNGVKDFQDALFYSKDTVAFMKAFPKAISSIAKKGDYYKAYVANGGKYTSFFEITTNFKADTVLDKVNPLRRIEQLNSIIEVLPRMMEFVATIDKRLDGADIAMAGKKVIDEAMYNANDITLNFGRSGKWSRMMNQTIVPYFNPSIQGFDKLVRTFKDNGVKGALHMGIKASTLFVPPLVLNQVMNHNVDGYEDLNSRDKDVYYLIPLGDQRWIKIPKSRTGSTLTSPIQHLFNSAAYQTPYEIKELFKLMISNSAPMDPLNSNLLSPIFNVKNNRTWWGGDIEYSSDEKLPVNERYDENTSKISIWLGQNKLAQELNLSPKKINVLLDGYTGVVGDFVLPWTASAAKSNPVVNKFVLDGIFSNRLSADFWDKNGELRMKTNSKNATAKDEEAYSKFGALYSYDASNLSQAIADIQNSNMSKREKSKMVREIRAELNKIYKAGKNGEKHGIDPVNVVAKQLGFDKALANYSSPSGKTAYEAYRSLENFKGKKKKTKEAKAKEFYTTYSEINKINDRLGWEHKGYPDHDTRAIGCALTKASENIYEAWDIYPDTKEVAKTYVDTLRSKNNTDKQIINKFVITTKALAKGLEGVNTSAACAKAMALATSKTKFSDASYYVKECESKMNAARGLTQHGWTTKQIANLYKKLDGGTSNADIKAVVESQDCSNEEKALLFNILAPRNRRNPYGSVGDYSLKKDTGIYEEESTGYSGGGRSYSRGGGGGGSSKGSKSAVDDWNNFVKDYISSAEKTAGVNFKDWDSPLDKSYQNKINSIIKKMEV